ncbi:interleukin-18-binding protein isoform X2 [Spea bombifrons]|uniref:interleukin-18-binding protein isoform X2 n=1 Tax=Spea bombifrons TaxID=233779 RepID=UPI00234BE7FD|nr:interleukin-18-binding protein isoform X2 [Spea bombifrons]
MPVAQPASSWSALKDQPKILYPENHTTITVDREKDFKLSCIAESTWPRFNIVYWLADNNFIENAFPDERVREVPETRNNSHSTTARVATSLVFSEIKPADLNTNFTCVIADPSGVDITHVTLKKPCPAEEVAE